MFLYAIPSISINVFHGNRYPRSRSFLGRRFFVGISGSRFNAICADNRFFCNPVVSRFYTGSVEFI